MGALAEVYYHLSRAPVMSSSHMRLNQLSVTLKNVLALTTENSANWAWMIHLPRELTATRVEPSDFRRLTVERLMKIVNRLGSRIEFKMRLRPIPATNRFAQSPQERVSK